MPQAWHVTVATAQLSQIPATGSEGTLARVSPDSKPAHVADAAGDAQARRGEHLVGLWWRRVPRVLWRPREVLVALRETDEDDEAARQEPILAIVLLAGMTAVLLMGGTLIDDRTVDGLVAAAVTFIAGAPLRRCRVLRPRARRADRRPRCERRRHVPTGAPPRCVQRRSDRSGVLPRRAGDRARLRRRLLPRRGALVERAGSCWRSGFRSSPGRPGLLVAGLWLTYRLDGVGMATALALAAVFVAVFVALPVVW